MALPSSGRHLFGGCATGDGRTGCGFVDAPFDLPAYMYRLQAHLGCGLVSEQNGSCQSVRRGNEGGTCWSTGHPYKAG